jgi:hypothetical protein
MNPTTIAAQGTGELIRNMAFTQTLDAHSDSRVVSFQRQSLYLAANKSASSASKLRFSSTTSHPF